MSRTASGEKVIQRAQLGTDSTANDTLRREWDTKLSGGDVAFQKDVLQIITKEKLDFSKMGDELGALMARELPFSAPDRQTFEKNRRNIEATVKETAFEAILANASRMHSTATPQQKDALNRLVVQTYPLTTPSP